MINTVFAEPPSAVDASGYEQSAYDLLTSTSHIQGIPVAYSEAALDTKPAHESLLVPDGLSLAQLDPLEGHRKKIVGYLEEKGRCEQQDIDLLHRDTLNLFLYSYFDCFHRHTPLLHVPKWSIATTSTPLFFAMVLVGAMYAGDLKKFGRLARSLYGEAEAYAWDSGPASILHTFKPYPGAHCN